MGALLKETSLDLLVVIGGGISAAVDAWQAAQNLNFDPSNILLVGAFLVGGNAGAIRAEKQGVLAGFLTRKTPAAALDLAQTTFPQISVGDKCSVALSSVNAMFHVPPMILNAMSVERGEDINIYVEGFGDSVGRLLLALDADRIRIGSALGLSLVPIDELNERYCGLHHREGQSLRERINTYQPTRAIKLPSSLDHRFLKHELQSTFAPLSEIARTLGVDVPTIRSVVGIGEVLLSSDLSEEATIKSRDFLRQVQSRGLSSGLEHPMEGIPR